MRDEAKEESHTLACYYQQDGSHSSPYRSPASLKQGKGGREGRDGVNTGRGLWVGLAGWWTRTRISLCPFALQCAKSNTGSCINVQFFSEELSQHTLINCVKHIKYNSRAIITKA